jgi:uncharacterized protein YjaG (DUF416 family)
MVVVTVTSPSLRYDEPGLVTALSSVLPTAQSIFAAACAERLLPVYRWFHERTGRGDPSALEDALAELWTDLEGQRSVQLESKQRMAEELVPHEDDSWIDDCAYAQHAAAAVAYAIRSRLTESPMEAGWAARQVYEALDLWVTTRDDVDLNVPGAEEQVAADPLIQAELARQLRDIDALKGIPAAGLAKLAPRMGQTARLEGLRLFGPQLN